MTSDRGAAAVLLLAVVVVGLLLGTALVGVGQVLVMRARVGAAADAAALAAAPVTFRPFGAMGTPAQEAARFAAFNGARLVSCRCPVDRSLSPRAVEVMVEVSQPVLVLGSVRVRAVGRAEFDPTSLVADPPPAPAGRASAEADLQ